MQGPELLKGLAACLLGAAAVILAWKLGNAAVTYANSDAYTRRMEFEPDPEPEPQPPTVH